MAKTKVRSALNSRGARSRPKKTKSIVSAKALNSRGAKKTVSFHMVRRVRSKATRKQTGIEATVEKWLIDSKANYQAEFPISRTHVDFYLPDTKTIVEVQGCYFHGCQACFGSELSKIQIKWRRRDARRFTFFRRAEYNLLLLWQHDIEKAPDDTRKKLEAVSK